jgi:glycosyltransferase involved in cell wall biosynthesis
MEENREKFVDKWREALKRQPRNLWAAASIDDREKVLVIGNIVPAPDRSSGGSRFYEFLRLLNRHYHVVLAYPSRFALREYVLPLERFGITVYYPGYAKAVGNQELDLVSILRNNEFKFIFFELFSMGEQYIDLVRKFSPGSTLVVDSYDVHFLREAREAKCKSDFSLQRKADQTKARELGVYRRADLVFTVTEADKQVLLEHSPRLKVAVVPNIHPFPETVSPRDQRKDLLFVGGFSHTPNVDAVLYFCAEVLPLLHSQLPGIKLHIIGNAPPVEIVALASDQVIVAGHVPHLVPYLNSAAVSVAPLRYGSGMKGKIGEAMAYGLPVVTTTIGAEGMDLRHGVDVLIADTPEAFAENVARLVQDTNLWDSISHNARQRLAKEWSPDAVDRKLTDILVPASGLQVATGKLS